MGLIDPSHLPGAKLDPDGVSTAATGLGAIAGDIRSGGTAVAATWQRLPHVFAATGTEELYAVMAPVGAAATAIGDGMDRVSSALTRYADDVRPILAGLDQLRADAEAFVQKAHSFGTKIESTGSWYDLGSPTLVTSWDQDPGMVDENNALIHRGAQLEAAWLDAQQRCATAIRAAAGLGPTGVADEQKLAAQLRSGGDIQTPWGTTQGRKESCAEKVTAFPAHFIWDGVIVGFGWNTLKGVGSLLGIDPTGKSEWDALHGLFTGNWSEWAKGQQESLDVMGHAWLGLAHLASGLLRPPGMDPMAMNAMLTSGAADWMPKGMRDALIDWNRQDGTAAYGTVAGLVGLTVPAKWWDAKSWKGYDPFKNWEENPGGTFGTAFATIGSFLIPGGEVADGVKVAADGTEVVKFGDLVDSGAAAGLRGMSASELRSVLGGLSEVDASRLAAELAKPELDSAALHALNLDHLQMRIVHEIAPLSDHLPHPAEPEPTSPHGAEGPAADVPSSPHGGAATDAPPSGGDPLPADGGAAPSGMDPGTSAPHPPTSSIHPDTPATSAVERTLDSALTQGLHDTAGRDITATVDASRLSHQQLARYLEASYPKESAAFVQTGHWPADVQIPKGPEVLKPNGTIDWTQARKGGYALDEAENPIKHVVDPPVGSRFDRYGPPDGRYTSPFTEGRPYGYPERSLPYVEDASQYHVYEWERPISDAPAAIAALEDGPLKEEILDTIDQYGVKFEVQEGPVAPAFHEPGGGIQDELPLPVRLLVALGIVKEIR